MPIWSNTSTLDGLVDDLTFTADKAQADIALIGGKSLILAEFPKLRGIFKCGVGRDNVPEAAAAARGIRCQFPSVATSDVIFEETASFACQRVLQILYTDLGDFAAWKKRERPALASQNLLVIGHGNIGRRVATKMRTFMNVTTFDTLTDSLGDLEGRMRNADCVTLHIPLTADSQGWIDKEKLGWLKDGAAIVNTARGPIIDETALLHELATGRIRAAIDVFTTEPYSGPLTALPADQVLLSPHVASNCLEFRLGLARDFRAFIAELTA